MTDQVLCALGRLFVRWQQLGESRGSLPLCEFEAGWHSPCELGEPHDGRVAWRPAARPEAEDFSALEQALELPLHPSIKALYGHWFSRPLTLWFKGLRLCLIQPWNQEDLDLLKENLIGHLLMQRKLGRTPTLFLASCRDEMGIISLDNGSGEVLFERLDSDKRTIIAPDLATFLDRLLP
ncbi:SecY-interacting protein [Aeromonas schubertii]|uniref:Protein Syd n=1 Tax=Aeromonas schubertii TaxID=652 RepID=A0A0S2SDT7_9GAMM|nr:SecY-interacting protein [Aeromonas schubertii]ALP39879.1 Syd protein [Aeromonas schubertii]KUE80111.1 protein syd [Aeromonas schubertii]MBZ6067714.1 SecY-interacting protein [Aeromonas schubertii]MBZ6071001.1 SecY-interacting protein [Aeromonas schubertii]QCG47382.1 SecY-interacting protein [Aeromonas schubertii]